MGNECQQAKYDESFFNFIPAKELTLKGIHINHFLPKQHYMIEQLKYKTLNSSRSTKETSYEKDKDRMRRISIFDSNQYAWHIKKIAQDLSPPKICNPGDQTYEYPNGVFKGTLKEGLRFGHGTFCYNDGSYFEGFWFDDMAEGFGKIIFADGDIYEGEFHQDQQHGMGMYKNQQMTYTGEWIQNVPQGEGKEEFQGYYYYEGQFFNGQKHGKGKITWFDDMAVYEGDFEENAMQGIGTYYYPEGMIYRGEFRNNKMNGKGQFEWPDGRKYVGNYVNGKKEGYGILYTLDYVYMGNWKNGLYDGYGTLKMLDETIEGYWSNGLYLQQQHNNNELY